MKNFSMKNNVNVVKAVAKVLFERYIVVWLIILFYLIGRLFNTIYCFVALGESSLELDMYSKLEIALGIIKESDDLKLLTTVLITIEGAMISGCMIIFLIAILCVFCYIADILSSSIKYLQEGNLIRDIINIVKAIKKLLNEAMPIVKKIPKKVVQTVKNEPNKLFNAVKEEIKKQNEPINY